MQESIYREGSDRKMKKQRRKSFVKRIEEKRKKLFLGLLMLFIFVIMLIIGGSVFFEKKSQQSFFQKINPITFAKASFEDHERVLMDGVADNNLRKETLYRTLTEQLGKPYKYGAVGPWNFDCSGLAQYAYLKVGVSLPRIAADQAKVGELVDKKDLKFGDILFFAKDKVNINHEGIYLEKGKMIHAPQTGEVVKISPVDEGYYEKTWVKAVRVLDQD